MKKLMLAVAVVFAAVSCKTESKNKVEVSEAKEVKTTEVTPTNLDLTASTIEWKGFKPTGEHFGTIAMSEGQLELNEGKLVGGSVVIDMNSILVKDMPADNEYNAKLVGHLKSADFFEVEKFPAAKFEFTEVTEANGKLSISGNLTIKENTKNITIPATLNTENGVSILKSEVFTIDRTDFDVRYGSKKFFDDLKDKFINDEFELSFEVKSAA